MFSWWRKASSPGKERRTVLQNIAVRGIKRACNLHLVSIPVNMGWSRISED
jgi:hypothetical protein